MIQFNLLPDVKQQYIKAKRQKHTTIVISLMVAAASLFIFTMLFLTVHVFQKAHLSNLDRDIKAKTSTLKGTTDLDKILTVQNQLNSLPDLHDQKPVTSRLFGYMSQVTPAQVNIGELDVDLVENIMTISGSTDSLGTVNKFVDTLKFTSYNEEGETANKDQRPFSDVVLASFSRSEKEATYQISLKYKPEIFDNARKISLVVPKIISSRSETEKPTDLFKALPDVQGQ